MKLSSLSVRRPVLATVMSLVIVIFGVIAFMELGVREYPSVESPVITVSTNYPGANATVIESQITEPIENQVNGIEGIRTLTSVSREGRSTVRAEFLIGTDLDRAANDVRDRVSRAQGQLPPDVDPPTISKADDDEDPIIFLNISSDRRDLLELTDLADNLFRERFQTIPGVSRVDIWGSKRYAMRMWIDPDKMAAHGLTAQDVRNAVSSENVELPSGLIEGEEVQLTVRTLSRLESPEEFNDLILKEEDGQTVRFRDIGYAELGPENERTILKRDGEPMVGVVLRPLAGANSIEIADAFYERRSQIEATMPADLQTAIGFDTTEFIRDSISEVQQTIFIALLLVMLVIFLFLRDWRTTIIPIVVIPVALIGTFFIMYLLGFSINVLTLLAVVLAIGIVVDDAIVVVENIYSKIEAGSDRIDAAIVGTREIFFAIVSTTLALVAVFTPILFLGGLTGRLFTEFGVTLAGAVIISSFVALTFTPMLCSKILKKRDKQPRFHRATEPFFRGMAERYRASLELFLRHRWMALVLVAACVVLGGVLYQTLPEELSPTEDRGGIRVFATGPEGATFEYMDRYVDEMIGVIQEEVPETDALITVTSPGFGAASAVNSAFARVSLTDASERDRSQMQIANHLSGKINELTRARAFVSQDQAISTGGGGGQPVQYVLQAPNLDLLRDAIPEFMEEARNSSVFGFVDVNLTFNNPEIEVSFDRNRIRNAGVSARDIGETLQLALSDQRIGFFTMNGEQYPVIAQVDRAQRNTTRDLQSLYVHSSNGGLVQLGNLVNVMDTNSPPQLFRFNRFSSATVQASLAPGYTLGDGLDEMDRIADAVLTESFSTALDGQSRDFVEGGQGLVFVFALALILVFLILAAQFESFRDPLIIMFTVPLALVGALLSLWYFDQTLNIFSQIGMIMLIGLVTKNGILIVEFANQRKAAGLSVLESIKEGAAVRFRPVLMTTISTTFGILPLALALGAGAESRMPMGIAVIGGLLIGTLFTLYIIPAMYAYLSSTDVNPAVMSIDAEEQERLKPSSASTAEAGDGASGAPPERSDVTAEDADQPDSPPPSPPHS